MAVKRWFWWAVGFQVLLLVGMMAVHGYTLVTGTPVTLQTAPVDPWNFMQGRYVQLNYTISRLQEGNTPMTGTPYRDNQTIWVLLQKGEPYWTLVKVSDQKPAAGENQVAIRGRVTSVFADYRMDGSRGTNQYFVQYGIEQFYVPEGERELDRRNGKFTVEAMVDSFGRAALHRVFLDGKQVQFQ